MIMLSVFDSLGYLRVCPLYQKTDEHKLLTASISANHKAITSFVWTSLRRVFLDLTQTTVYSVQFDARRGKYYGNNEDVETALNNRPRTFFDTPSNTLGTINQSQ